MSADSRHAHLLRLVQQVARRIRHAVRSMLGFSRRYELNSFTITLPADHALWIYQAEHPKYDRFLPHLSRFLSSTEVVVDIGANVGDSLAAMVDANPDLTYICVEADEVFYQHLIRNIETIKRAKEHLEVYPVKCLVGKSVAAVGMEGKQGTKHAVVSDNGPIKARSLDEIVETFSVMAEVRLIKTDVDGFDFDVLDSALGVIERFKPLIFFECHCTAGDQKAGFERMLGVLQNLGYLDWAVFDNFGQLILRTDDIGTVQQLMLYTWRQSEERATRTIHYVDIFASQPKDSDLVSRVLSGY